MSNLEAGTVVRKKSRKPFADGEKTSTIVSVVPHPFNEGREAYTFAEHDTVVDVRQVVKLDID